MKKLAIITTHPIQYNAPLFRLLHERRNIEIKVFYTWSQTEAGAKYDPGFQRNILWDIPLLEGYPYIFSENISKSPGSDHYKGIDNPFLQEEITRWGANALLIYGWNFKSHLKAIRHFKKKIPVLFRGDSTLLDEQAGLKQLLRRIWLKYVYSNVDMALYAGLANKEYFLKHGMKEGRLAFMPHATDNERFSANAATFEKAKALRKHLAIPPEAVVFLFAGKLEEKKQPGILAERFSQVYEPGFFLVIAGSGKLETALKEKFGAHPGIKFLGFQNQQQMPALYAACDVFVLPSKGPGETWGLSVNEAMAAGKAVIVSTACGAAFDLVKDSVNGFVINRNKPSDLLEAFCFFLKYPRETISMGSASQKIIRDFSFEKDCSALENAVRKLAGKNKK